MSSDERTMLGAFCRHKVMNSAQIDGMTRRLHTHAGIVLQSLLCQGLVEAIPGSLDEFGVTDTGLASETHR